MTLFELTVVNNWYIIMVSSAPSPQHTHMISLPILTECGVLYHALVEASLCPLTGSGYLTIGQQCATPGLVV